MKFITYLPPSKCWAYTRPLLTHTHGRGQSESQSSAHNTYTTHQRSSLRSTLHARSLVPSLVADLISLMNWLMPVPSCVHGCIGAFMWPFACTASIHKWPASPRASS